MSPAWTTDWIAPAARAEAARTASSRRIRPPRATCTADPLLRASTVLSTLWIARTTSACPSSARQPARRCTDAERAGNRSSTSSRSERRIDATQCGCTPVVRSSPPRLWRGMGRRRISVCHDDPALPHPAIAEVRRETPEAVSLRVRGAACARQRLRVHPGAARHPADQHRWAGGAPLLLHLRGRGRRPAARGDQARARR